MGRGIERGLRAAASTGAEDLAEFFQLIHPDDRERAGRQIGALLEQGSEIEYQFRAVAGDRIVWIYDPSTLMRDAEGRRPR